MTKPLLGPNDTLLSMSDDGTLVSYVETSDQGLSLFVRNLTSGETQFIAPISMEAGANAADAAVAIGGVLSANGHYLFYRTGPADQNATANGAIHLIVKNLQDGTSRDVTPTLPQASGSLGISFDLRAQAISDDGSTVYIGETYVDFSSTNPSFDGEVVQNVANGSQQQFASANSSLPDNVKVTPDGRYLSYYDGGYIVRDLYAGTSFRPGGLNGSISDTSRYTVFTASSNASGQVASSDTLQVFVHDNTLPTGVNQVVTTNAADQLANGDSLFVALSGDGRHVVFSSSATNILPGITDGAEHLYVKNLDSGVIQILQIAPSNTVFISYDGSRIIAQESGGATQTDYAPPVLTVSPVSGDNLVNAKEPTVTVSGTSDAIGQTVLLSLEGTNVSGSAVVQANGTWSTLLFIGAPKPDGVHTIDATVTDVLTTTTTHPFTVDTTPPSLTLYSINGGATVNAAEASSITIVGSATDGSPNSDGTSDEAGQPVSLSVDNKAIGAPKVLQNGVWVFQYDGASLTDGQHELEYSVADQAGNVTKSSIYFNVDKTPPKIAITSIGDQDVVTAADYQNGAVIKGTSDAIGSTVDVYVNYSDLKATVAADGTWQATASFDGSPSGWQTVTATVFDAAGNVGTTTSSALVENGIIEVSTTATGVSGTGTSHDESVSGDGQIVAFAGDQPEISGLVPVTDTAASLAVDAQVIYVKNVETGAISVDSKMLDGSAPDGDSWLPAISQNGNFVAFLSDATDLVAGDTNGPGTLAGLDDQTPGVDVFETDLSTGVTQRVDTTSSGGQVDGTTVQEVDHQKPAISADGRYVAFVSDATGLVAGVSGTQIYLKDLQTGTVSLVSADTSGAALTGDNLYPSMSADGRYVAFSTTASGGYTDPARSGDGYLDDVFDNSVDPASDVFVRDTQTGTLTLVSSTAAGVPGNGPSYGPVTISPDGQYVAYDTFATDLDPAGPGAPQTVIAGLTLQTVIRNLATGQVTQIPGTYVDGGFTADDQFLTVIPRDENNDYGTIEVYNLKTGALSNVPGVGGEVSADGKSFVFDDIRPFTASSSPVAYQGYDFVYQQQLQSTDALTFAPITGDNQIDASEIHDVPLTGTSNVTGGTVTIAIDGVQLKTAVVGSDGTWSTTIDASTLFTGSHAFTATVHDAAGFSTSAGEIVTVAGSPTVLTTHLADDTGSSARDRTTNKPLVTGRGAANSVVSFTVDGVVSTTTATANAAGIYSFIPTGLADGSHMVASTQTDAAGNTETSEALNFTLDTTAPIVAIASPGTSVAMANQTIAGTVDAADAGSLVSLYDNGSATPLGTGIVQANGAWSSFVTLSPGTNDLVARVTDAAGNIGTASVDVVLDATTPPPPDTLVLQMAEDAYQGDAQFEVTVDGKQVGGPETVTALEGAGQTQSFTLTGAFGAGPHTVGIDFLNDAYGNSPSTDRNLYVKSLTLDGVTTTEDAGQYRQGVASYAVTTAPDTLLLDMSEDAYQGDAAFTVTVDGKSVGGPMTVTALHDAGQTQTFALSGTFGTGPHAVGIDFLNDAYGNSPTTDRNLYVNAVTLDGVTTEEDAAQYGKGVATYAVRATQPDLLTLKLSEDAYKGDAAFTVSVDGKQVGGPQTVTALHGAGNPQVFTFAGSFAAGSHDVTIDFLNDAWGGTPATDRNLYVDSIGLNGTTTAENAAQFTAGNAHYAVSGPATATPGTTPLTIDSGATLVLDKSAGASAVQFGGSGSTLQLTSAETFHGAIGGFAGTDVLDLRSIGFGAGTTASLAYSGTTSAGVLSLSDGTHTANLALQGSFSTDMFSLGADAFGGTVVALKHA